jgi:sulfate permease, SulP family
VTEPNTAQTFKETSDKSWPVFRSLRGYQFGHLPGDLIAGLTLAAIAIPEQMATARLGGFPPQLGFLAFVAGSLGFALLGGNRFSACPLPPPPPRPNTSRLPSRLRCWSGCS